MTIPLRTEKSARALRHKSAVADMMAALLWSPKTLLEVTAAADVREDTARVWIQHMRAAGVVYVAEWRPNARGRRTAVYAIQPRPFAHQDATPPKPRERLTVKRDRPPLRVDPSLAMASVFALGDAYAAR